MTRRVAVFRALYLGDMVCSVPALRALRQTVPEAKITLISLPWAAEFAGRYRDLVDDFVAFPGGEHFVYGDDGLERRFIDEMRSRGFDLAVQLHGSGDRSNAVVESFEAAQTAGFTPDAASGSPHYVLYPSTGHEIERLVLLMRNLGC